MEPGQAVIPLEKWKPRLRHRALTEFFGSTRFLSVKLITVPLLQAGIEPLSLSQIPYIKFPQDPRGANTARLTDQNTKVRPPCE